MRLQAEGRDCFFLVVLGYKVLGKGDVCLYFYLGMLFSDWGMGMGEFLAMAGMVFDGLDWIWGSKE